MIAGKRLVVRGGDDDDGSDGWSLYGLVMGLFDAFANLYYCSLVGLGAVRGKVLGGRLFEHVACS